MTQHGQRTSEIMKQILARCDEKSVTIGKFTSLMGDRAFALAILFFSLPGLVAGAIPGFSTLVGVPILLIAAQMALGRRSIWLPESVAQKEISEDVLKKTLEKSIPAVEWLEKYLKPRLKWLANRWSEQLIGVVIALLAAILSLPIPGGNFLPSIGIVVLALAILEGDGALAAAGLAFVAGSAIFMFKLIVLAFHMVSGWVSDLSGWITGMF